MGVTKDEHQLTLTMNGQPVGNSLKALEQAASKLRKEIKNVEIGSADWVKKTEEYNKISDRIKKVTKDMSSLKDEGNKGSSMWSTFKAGLLGAFTGAALWDGVKALTTGLFNIGKGAVSAYSESQVAAGKLKYQLVTLGGESEKTFNILLDQADKLEKSTFGFTAETIQDQQAALKTFGLTGAEIQKLMPVILDYATVTKKDLGAATDDVKNALLGKDKALKEVGITLEKNQMTVEGVTGAFGKFKGAAEDALNIGTNKLEKVTDILGDLQEDLGEKLIPIVQAGADVMVDLLENIEPLEEVVETIFTMFGDLSDAFWDIINTLFPFTEGVSKGSMVMKTFALVLNVLTLPLKILISQFSTAAYGLQLLVNEGKKAANYFGADFKIDPNISFKGLLEKNKEEFDKIKKSFVDIFEDQKEQVEKQEEIVDDTFSKILEAERKAAEEAEKQRKEREKKRLEAIKKRNEELKKLEEQAAIDRLEAQKNIELLAIELIKDDEKKRIASLKNRAAAEISVLKGTEEQKATQEELIQERLQRDITAIREEAEKKRAAKELELKNRSELAKADLEIIYARGTEELIQASIAKLEVQKEIELQNENLLQEERLLIQAEYAIKQAEIEDRLRSERRAKDIALADSAVSLITGGLQAIADFEKISGDKAIAQAEKVKSAKIKKLDEELASKKISQAGYDYMRQQAEEELAKKTAKIKTEQAKKEKNAKVADSIMTGILAVVKALPNYPLAIATGILAGLSTAKIIATPVPEYATGGLIQGATHAEGGIKLFDTKAQKVIGEIEGKEFILNAGISENPDLLREAHSLNNRARKFAEGGALNNPLAPSSQVTAAINGTSGGSTAQISSQELAELQALRREFILLRTDVSQWPDKLKVINYASETQAAINVINETQEDNKF